MTPTGRNRDLVAGIYEAMAGADLDEILKRCHADVTITQAESLPWGGHYEGKEGLIEFVTKLITTIDSKVAQDVIFEAGDHVVQRGRTQGTVRATGVEFDVPEVHVWTIRDGKVAAAHFYIDTPLMLEALEAEAEA
jgi:ketosteroid isomerase-like protein